MCRGGMKQQTERGGTTTALLCRREGENYAVIKLDSLYFSKKKVLGLHQQQQHQQQHNANGRRRLSISRPFSASAAVLLVVPFFFPYFSYIFSFFSYFNQQQPPLYTLWYLILDFLKLAGTYFLWERGFRRDINVYKVIKFKPGEERKRKKTGISTDRRRRTYIWVRDDQQLYRKHFFQKWTIYPEV